MATFQIGYWIGGFLIAMAIGYICINLAWLTKNKSLVLALSLIVPLLIYAISGQNPGAIAAAVCCFLIARRQAQRRSA